MTTEIIGTGSYLPEKIVTNDQLAKVMVTSDEWIYSRTGIHSRHIAVNETVADMAAWAALAALENAGASPKEISMIIVATITGEQSMPGTAGRVQAAIGAVNAAAFDIGAACSGFIYALDIADSFIKSNPDMKILIIGAEAMSRSVDWKDRSTCVLFGDGAGAAVIAAGDTSMDTCSTQSHDAAGVYIGSTQSHDSTGNPQNITGIKDIRIYSDGKGAEYLYMNDRKNRNMFEDNENVKNEAAGNIPYDRCIHMDGQKVFQFAVKTMPEAIRAMLEDNGIKPEEIDMYILHQANTRIISSVAKRLGVDVSRFPQNLETVGNTSAASIPVLLDELNKKNMLKEGMKLVIAGFGGGLSWGTAFIIWQQTATKKA